MRILYLDQYFVPLQGTSGTRCYEFARHLMARGHEVFIITSSAMLAEPYRSISRKTEVNIDGIPMIVLPVKYSNEMLFNQRIKAFFRFALSATWESVRHPADVVFATSTPLTIAIPGIAAHLWHRIPMVFEVRDLWPEIPIALGTLHNPIAKAMARVLEWLAYHTSAHIIALSPGMAEGIQRRGISSNRVTVIPNSCDLDLFDVPAIRGQKVRERLKLLPDQPLVVYTGAFGLINGLSYLVDIAVAARKIAPEVCFLLIGTGAEREKVIAKARDLSVLNQNLWIWDPIPKKQMPDILAASTVATSFVIPLEPLWNNSANKFFDALASSKPVVINHRGWQADLLEESGAGIIIPPNEPMKAAQELVSFVRDADRLRRAREASRSLAQTKFDRRKLVDQLEIILQQSVER